MIEATADLARLDAARTYVGIVDDVKQPFADRLAALVEERESQIVLGLDPDPNKLWPEAQADLGEDLTDPARRTAAAISRQCCVAIDAVASACVAVKFQTACFERLGPWGWEALGEGVKYAQDAGLLAIVDGKRGDVPVTAEAYAQALVYGTSGPYGRIPSLGVDAFMANPLLGRDAMEPLVNAAAESNAGVFCLVRTSNPGAADVQDKPRWKPLHKTLARLVNELGAEMVSESGLSAVGAVVAATRPQLLKQLRKLMPNAVFLMPGVGAQGGEVSALAHAFRPHPAAGLIASSRSIVNAHETRGGDPATAAAAAAEDLRVAAWQLSCKADARRRRRTSLEKDGSAPSEGTRLRVGRAVRDPRRSH
jgi:orotidine-5'-phosphate decarboxylase